MRAALRIHAAIGESQPLHRPPVHQVFIDNFRRIFWLHKPVPHRVGIHDHRGPVFTLVQAAGLVDANPVCQTGGLAQLLQLGVEFTFTVGCARWARRTCGADVVTNKNMAFERGQSGIPPFSTLTGTALQKGFHNTCCRPARICENDCLAMNKDNLISLKDDMVAFIEGHGMRRLPGYVTEDVPSVLWDDQGNSEAWKDFVEMAKHVGSPFVTFSEMTLDREELDALIEEAGEMNFPDEEATELVEAQWLRKYSGMLGYIQLGFVHQGIVFLHETTTEWYERYQALLEDIESFQDIVIDDAHEGTGDEDE